MVGAVETGAAPVPTATVFPIPRPQTVRCTAHERVSPSLGFQSSSHRQEKPMQSSARVFNCARCRCQVVICSHCDRGNIYCGKRCSQTARHQSQREAGRRYQRTYRGRLAHAARQRRLRQRRRAKVTHQGSPAVLPDETLPAESRTSARRIESPPAVPGDGIGCHLCGRVCSHFLRQTFLRRRPTREAIDLPPPVRAQSQGP
jgi:hypothetical protein